MRGTQYQIRTLKEAKFVLKDREKLQNFPDSRWKVGSSPVNNVTDLMNSPQSFPNLHAALHWRALILMGGKKNKCSSHTNKCTVY